MASQNLVFDRLKDYLLASLLSHFLLVLVLIIIIKKLACHSKSKSHGHQDLLLRQQQDLCHPRPSSVPVPLHFVTESLEEQLPLMTYTSFLEKKGESSSSDHLNNDGTGESSCLCIVCMDCMAASDMVRVPSNCRHAFHRDCLDGWINQGHGTCPLCRSKLSPISYQSTEKSRLVFGGDPWRVERMIYLFGEDYAMEFADDL